MQRSVVKLQIITVIMFPPVRSHRRTDRVRPMERKSVECPLGASCNAGGRHFPDSTIYRNHAQRATGNEKKYDFSCFDKALDKRDKKSKAKAKKRETGIDLSSESAFVTGLGGGITEWAKNDAGDIYDHVSREKDPKQAAQDAIDEELSIDWAHDSIYGYDSPEQAVARAKNYLAQRPDAELYADMDEEELMGNAQARLAEEYDEMFRRVAGS